MYKTYDLLDLLFDQVARLNTMIQCITYNSMIPPKIIEAYFSRIEVIRNLIANFNEQDFKEIYDITREEYLNRKEEILRTQELSIAHAYQDFVNLVQQQQQQKTKGSTS